MFFYENLDEETIGIFDKRKENDIFVCLDNIYNHIGSNENILENIICNNIVHESLHSAINKVKNEDFFQLYHFCISRFGEEFIIRSMEERNKYYLGADILSDEKINKIYGVFNNKNI